MTDSPTYEIYLSVNNVGTSQINEGDTLRTMVWMKNGGFISRIHSGTPLFYSLSGIGVNSDDFVSGALIGTGELDDTGLMTLYHTLASDDFMEGDESLNIKIFSDSDRTIQVSDTTTILIKDILNNPTYTIDTSHSTIQEGETLTISISTTMVPTGTDLYFINSGEGITGSDFSIGTLTPFTTVDSSGNASLTQTILSDKTTEGNETLNVKSLCQSLNVPVIAGNCVTYEVADLLMKAGVAGLMVGIGPGAACTSRGVLGIGIPQATAISDCSSARDDFFEETGRYVPIIADGGIITGGDICNCLACGSDAVMIGSPIAKSLSAPGNGFHWGMATPSPVLPRGTRINVGSIGSLERILRGPAKLDDGTHNLLGCLKTSMGTLGARTIKEMQQVEVVVAPSLLTEGKVYQKAQQLGMGK